MNWTGPVSLFSTFFNNQSTQNIKVATTKNTQVFFGVLLRFRQNSGSISLLPVTD